MPYYSTLLVDDPDMVDLVEMFVDEVPDRLEAMSAALAAEDLELVCRLAHQFKGAVGSHGYHPVVTPAMALEFSARDGEPVKVVESLLHELVTACGELRAEAPPEGATTES